MQRHHDAQPGARLAGQPHRADKLTTEDTPHTGPTSVVQPAPDPPCKAPGKPLLVEVSFLNERYGWTAQ